jgi:hemin uptake protein HemP
MAVDPDAPSNDPQPAASENEGPRVLASHELFAGKRELIIRHGNRHYRLQITKAGKLILNK